MTLLIINGQDDIVQTIEGAEDVLDINKQMFSAQGYRCVYADTAPHLANKMIDGVPTRVEPVVDQLLLLRQERDQYLTLCDWTQMPDVPLSMEKKAEWAVYRQALRDFPETCDPDNPVWPTPPI